jgi:hypothetical protein
MSAQGKKHETLSKKMTKVKKGWRCSSSGENLPSVQGPGVSSKPSTAKKKKKKARQGWLTAVILVTQESEIRKMAVQSQHGQIVCEIIS